MSDVDVLVKALERIANFGNRVNWDPRCFACEMSECPEGCPARLAREALATYRSLQQQGRCECKADTCADAKYGRCGGTLYCRRRALDVAQQQGSAPAAPAEAPCIKCHQRPTTGNTVPHGYIGWCQECLNGVTAEAPLSGECGATCAGDKCGRKCSLPIGHEPECYCELHRLPGTGHQSNTRRG